MPVPTAETPAISTANVLVGLAALYTAPANTVMPPDTLAQNAAWPSPWVPVGATEEGVILQVQRETQDIRVEEQSTPVDVAVTTTNVRVNTTLAEDTITTMKLAYGGGQITTVAAGPTQVAKTVLTLSDTLDQLAVGFEGTSPEGYWRRFYIPLALSVAEVSTAYRRSAAERQYAVSLRAICAVSQIQTADMTGPHT